MPVHGEKVAIGVHLSTIAPAVAWVSEFGTSRAMDIEMRKSSHHVKRKWIAEQVAALCDEGNGELLVVVMERWSLFTKLARLATALKAELGKTILVPSSTWRKWVVGYQATMDDVFAHVRRVYPTHPVDSRGVAIALCLAEFGLKLMEGQVDWP